MNFDGSLEEQLLFLQNSNKNTKFDKTIEDSF